MRHIKMHLNVKSGRFFSLRSGGVRAKSSPGFTLLELLVVIAIIAMLASIILASLNTARAKARDAKRMEDLRQIRTALELYVNDHHGQYPCETASNCTGQSVGANGKVGEGAGLDTLLAPYMTSISHDPKGPGDPNYYYYYDGAQSCDGRFVAVVFARNLEAQAGNASQLCSSWGGEGGAGGANAWHIIVGPSSG